MPIALDFSNSGSTVTNTSLTYTHTASGLNLVLFVAIDIDSASDLVTSVLHGGVAMTRLNTVVTGGSANRRAYLYYLLNPQTGTKNIVVTLSSAHDIHSESASYTGVKQTGFPDNSTTDSSGVVPSRTTPLTTIADNSWIISTISTPAGIPTTGSGLTARQTQNAAGLADSNGPLTPAGVYNTTWNLPVNQDTAICIASFAPFLGSASVSPSISPSSSPSASVSSSISPSASQSPSASISPSSSESPSVSPSGSLSPSSSQSPSPSASQSPSGSGSASGSASGSSSQSSSPSASQSPSSSGSKSQSPSGSKSPSASGSFSASSSGSASGSKSQSPSGSTSASPSPSLPDHILSVDFIEICYTTGYADKYATQNTRYDQNLYVKQNTTFTDIYGNPC